MRISGTQIILWIMAAFSILGTIDRILPQKYKRGYGEAFERGIQTTGPLILSMAATYAIAPSLAALLKPIVTPICTAIGTDPGVFPGMLLAADMGGYPLAVEMAGTEAVGNFGGLVLGTMMGVTIVFTIPVFLPMISKEDTAVFSLGILCGVLTIPLGAIAGGLLMGLSMRVILVNLLPLVVLAAIIALGLLFCKNGTIRVFCVFGRIVSVLLALLFGVAAFQSITGIILPVFGVMQTVDPGVTISRLDEGLLVCARIGVMLTGAFPLMRFLEKHLSRVLQRAGAKAGVSSAAILGMIANLANSLAMMQLFPEMDRRGKLYNIAFTVSASFLVGDHLAFAASVQPDMVVPMLVGKAVAGVGAVLLAAILAPRILEKA